MGKCLFPYQTANQKGFPSTMHSRKRLTKLSKCMAQQDLDLQYLIQQEIHWIVIILMLIWKMEGLNNNYRTYKVANDASRDSDSLIQGYYDCSSQENLNRSCFNHPKVQENWRMVLAAATLLIIGLGLLMTGMITLAEPNSGLQGSVFLLAGFICFLPGIYHIVYIYLAAKGKRGYHFHNLPLFT
ncbi:transmembrane protein 134 isoform X2 [Leptinotarsa decemlineata]|uniref:transmembrane protein 134 isoform X2 n=1 Tax=Leptinotarsa decemlineata TaxID=7539 RepID=UPI000C25568B|nr:transmembrane protein 134 isoform X2 [Leptinotarsa decemlineata]